MYILLGVLGLSIVAPYGAMAWDKLSDGKLDNRFRRQT